MKVKFIDNEMKAKRSKMTKFIVFLSNQDE